VSASAPVTPGETEQQPSDADTGKDTADDVIVSDLDGGAVDASVDAPLDGGVAPVSVDDDQAVVEDSDYERGSDDDDSDDSVPLTVPQLSTQYRTAFGTSVDDAAAGTGSFCDCSEACDDAATATTTLLSLQRYLVAASSLRLHEDAVRVLQDVARLVEQY
jgi:hypothetical protein